MEYTLTIFPKSEIEIEVTIPFSEFEPQVKKAAVLISEEIEIEGFRKGKAPYDLVKNKVGEHTVYERAAELAVRKTYPKILSELVTNNQLLTPIGRPAEGEARPIVPIGRPEITITKLAPGNELQYKVKLTLLPAVLLPDYQALAARVRKDKKAVSVSEEEVEKTINWIRESRSTGEGEERKTPELTDEFTKTLGDFASVEALKTSIREGLTKEKEEKENQRIRALIIEEVAQEASMEIPSLLIDSELEKMFQELKSGIEQMGMKWEDYLSHIKKNQEELKKEWQGEAEKRVKIALCLREIARLEKIEPSEEEITKRAHQFLEQFKSSAETEKSVDPEELKEYTRGILRNEKVFEFLETV